MTRSLVLLLGSCALVFGTLVWFVLAPRGSDLPLGYEQLIHARIPWIVLSTLWVGGSLGIASLLLKRPWYTWIVVGLEVPCVLLLSFFFLEQSFLPNQKLALEVGDRFPGYALMDQDGDLNRLDAGKPRERALYIFYRGDW